MPRYIIITGITYTDILMSNYQTITNSGMQKESTIVKTSLRLHNEIFWSVKKLALDRRRSVTELADEAFRDLLKKYGKVLAGGVE
jgi:hypothetical protein